MIDPQRTDGIQPRSFWASWRLSTPSFPRGRDANDDANEDLHDLGKTEYRIYIHKTHQTSPLDHLDCKNLKSLHEAHWTV